MPLLKTKTKTMSSAFINLNDKTISDDSSIIKEQRIGAIIEEFNSEAYLKAIREIDLILQSCSRQELIQRIRAVAVKHRNFSDAAEIYKKIYGASMNE